MITGEEPTAGYSILDLGFNKLLTLGTAIPTTTTPEMTNNFSSGTPSSSILAGDLIVNLNQKAGTLYNGKSGFDNTATGYILGVDSADANKLKFYIGNTTNYLNWTGTSLVISGGISATSIDIGSGWHVDSSGNMWWGADATYAAATIKISSAGAVNFTTGTFSGVLQTAVSGQRIDINNSSNAMRFFDSAGQVIGIGTDAGQAITLALNSTTNSGIIVSSSVAGFALSYSNSLSNLNGNAGISLNLTGASNTAANIQITNNGTTGAQGILMTITGAAVGMYIGHSSTADAIQIVGSSVFTALDITSNFSAGSPTAISLSIAASSSGSPNGISITLSSASGTATALVLSLGGSGSNNYLFSHAAGAGPIVNSSVGGSQNKKVRVNIGGAVYFIPLYDA